MMRCVMLCLLLAGRAIITRTLPLIEVTHGRGADPARVPSALIDKELLTKISGSAIGAHVIAQSCAADADCSTQDRAHRAHQSRGLNARQFARLPRWADPGTKQGLSLIHISEPTRLGMISY